MDNTFTVFKTLRNKPCSNFALIYHKKLKVFSFILIKKNLKILKKERSQLTYNVTAEGETSLLYNIKQDLWVTFQSDELKLITQAEAYPFWSFGAEVGGYIGMFLGVSFMQVGVIQNSQSVI